jgi:signal transduction histidine kinase
MWNSSWLTTRRLQSQLVAWTALILIVSVVGTAEIRTRANIRLLEQNLRDRTETLLRAVDHALGLGSLSESDFLPVDSLQQKLREFVQADQTLTRLDIVQQRNGHMFVLASTANDPSPLLQTMPSDLATEVRQIGNERAMISVEPVKGTSYGIVAVSSLQNVDRYEAFNRRQTPIFAAILILMVILLMHFMYKHMISRRFDELLQGIHRAKEGETAGILDNRQDEIGVIARTLNGLLLQVQSFNEELRRQVASATGDLNKRNVALEETTRQMLEMQKQLVESERMAAVGQMAATFAHEIGSPMTSLSAHVQLLLEDPQLSGDQRESLGVIRQQIQTTVQIVNEMLRSARRGPSDFVLTDLNDILRNVIRLVHPKLMSQKIDPQMDLEPIPLVRGYPVYLQEAFLNIINNASDAMAAGGRLSVQSWFDPRAELVNVRITDTGHGIDPSVVAKMFDHFVTTKAMGEGTGLGLGIVKEIVDSHRGTLQIAAVTEGGTAAHITFPVETTAVLAS